MRTYHHKCCYVGCKNIATKTCGISFFKFPIRDSNLVSEWLKNCGNVKLIDKDIKEIKSKKICEKHFHPRDIICSRTSKLKRLRKHAVPKKFNSADEISTPPAKKARVEQSPETNELEEEQLLLPSTSKICKTYERIRKFPDVDTQSTTSSGGSSQISDRPLFVPPKCHKLRYKIRDLRRELRYSKNKYSQLLKSKCLKGCFQIVMSLLLLKSTAVKTFVTMQCFHKHETPWTKKERQLALSIFHKSPSAYKFLRENLKFTLPPERVIYNWLQIRNLRTGLDTKVIEHLSEKAKTMSAKEREAVLLMDEISLKKDLKINWSLDEIEGYEDLGRFGKFNKIANSALVFYLRGLYHKWKFPFCYYISAGPILKGKVKRIIKEVIAKLLSISINPRAIICDQAPNNMGAFALLKINKERPYFFVNNCKIYALYDVPHLINSVRNNLMNPNINFFVENKKVSWDDIRQVYELDMKNTTSRALNKISDIHLNPNAFQKMRVKYATQVLSHTVSAALQTAVKLNQITSESAADTAKFIENINKIFDALNSRYLLDRNKHKRPLSIFNNSPENILKEGKELFKNIKITSQDSNIKSDVYCIDGFIWTITGILSLWEDLKKEDMKYLLTSHLNLDPLEVYFSLIRSRGGYNPFPSIPQFRIWMQHNMLMSLQRDINANNCEVDEDMEHLELSNLKDALESLYLPDFSDDVDGPAFANNASIPTDLEGSSNILGGDQLEDGDSQVNDILEDSPAALQTCSSTSLAGYLACSIFKKFKCFHCADTLLKYCEEPLEENEDVIFDYNTPDAKYLKRPSDELNTYINILIKKFPALYEDFKLSTGFTANIRNECKTIMKEFRNLPCETHLHHLISLFIEIMLNRINKNIIQKVGSHK